MSMNIRIDKTFFTVLISSMLLAACAGTGGHGSNPKKNLELIKASRQGNANLVAQLLESGADMNAVDADGWTPYLAASVEGNWAVMKILQTRGAKTDPGF